MNEKRNLYLTAVPVFCSFVMLGASMFSLGPALGHYARLTSGNLESVNPFFIVKPLGFMIGCFFCGRLIQIFGLGKLLPTCALLIALLLNASLWFTNVWAVGFVLFLLSIVEGLMEIVGNYFILRIFKSRGRKPMVLLHFCFGVGAILAPFLIGFDLEHNGNVAASYLFIGLLALVVWGTYLAFRRSLPQKAEPARKAEKRVKVRPAIVILTNVVFIAYVGAETGFANWIFHYMRDVFDYRAHEAGMTASLFWISGAFCRLGGLLYRTPDTAKILRVHCLLSLVFILIPLFLGWGMAHVFTAFLLGAAYSLVFPSFVFFLEEKIGLDPSSIGRFLTLGTTGALIVPWLIGKFYVAFSPDWLYYVILACTLIFCLAFFALDNMFRRKSD